MILIKNFMTINRLSMELTWLLLVLSKYLNPSIKTNNFGSMNEKIDSTKFEKKKS